MEYQKHSNYKNESIETNNLNNFNLNLNNF